MKGIFIFSLLSMFITLISPCNRIAGNLEDIEKDTRKLVWSDEFDKDGLPDESKWSYDVGTACDKPCGCGWGNHELQYYTEKRKENARVENGHLIIEVHNEKFKDRDYTSARLVSKNKGDWKYGKIDIRAKVASGKGVWSAIWMLPTENKYGGWPGSGEIDIMENVGFDQDTIVGSAHTLNYYHLIGTHKNGKINIPKPDEDFHVYTLDWKEDQYTVAVDGQTYFTFVNERTDYKSWPFDQEFHLLLNIAYGGDWGGEQGISPELLPAKMTIDYVRVYQ